MTSQEDDCYFFYYSTCAKGDECPYRHEPAALGNEVTCEQWEQGRCTKPACNFRHMVITKHRSQTACYWESQRTGCLKPYCPFLHTKPRPSDRPSMNVVGAAPGIHQAPSRSAAPVSTAPVPVAASSVGQQEVRKIPTISSPPRPRPPMPQNAALPGQPAARIPYPAVTSRPMLVPQPQPGQVMRTPQFTGPPRPPGMVQPVPARPGYPPLLPAVQLRYGRAIPTPHVQQSYHHPLIYTGRPDGSAMPYLPTKIHENEYDNQDYDSYSSSESDEERGKSREMSHRRVRSSSNREVFASNRREVRSNRRQQSSKQRHERYKSGGRRRPDVARDKSKDSSEAERERSKERRKPSRKSQKDENEERERRDSNQETKTNASKEEKNAEEKAEKEEEKSNEANDASSPGIKVKTLEEILREKALKKLEERRAQNKVQKDAQESKEEETMSEIDKDTEKTLEEVSSVNKSESNENSLVANERKPDVSIDSSTEKLTAVRKVSVSDKKSPVKKVIKTKKISVNKNNNSVESSTEKAIATKRISVNAEDSQSGEGKVSSNEPPSPFQEVRVKSFDEIMQEKRKRKAEESPRGSSEDVSGEMNASVKGEANSSMSAVSIPPKRLKRIVRKSSGDSDKEAKVVSSSGADDTASKVKVTRKRTVYVMDKTSPTKENGVSSTDTKEDKPKKITFNKAAVAERLETQEVKVKSFAEIMAEKRQRASQENVEVQKSKEVPDEDEKRPSNVLWKSRQTKPLKTGTAREIKPRKIKVWTQGAFKVKAKEDDVSSSTTDTTPKEQESQDQTVPSDIETTKLHVASLSSETSEADSLAGPDLTFTMDQPHVSDQSTPDKDSCFNDATPSVEDASIGLQQQVEDKMSVDSGSREAEPSTETTQMEQEPESLSSSLEKPQDSLPDHTVIEDSDQPMEQLSAELKGSKEPPSYDEIKQAIENEMSKKDDFFAEFGADIDLGEDDGDDTFDVNEDDLLMELDEMIND